MKTAKLFKNGQSQAVRLPKQFRLSGDEVFIKKIGNVVVLIPRNDPWKSLRESLQDFSPDFMKTARRQPTVQTRKGFD